MGSGPERIGPGGRGRPGYRTTPVGASNAGGPRQTEGMTVVIWVAENTWQACVDAARSLAPADAGITLLTVVDTTTAETAHGAFGGLLGRGGADPAQRVLARSEAAANELLDRAQSRLGCEAGRLPLKGKSKHEIAAAVTGATMLIVGRDGHGPGPKSLGKDVRFVVDHAPCPVLLIWPGPPPPVPPPPPPGAHPPPVPPPPPPGAHPPGRPGAGPGGATG